MLGDAVIRLGIASVFLASTVGGTAWGEESDRKNFEGRGAMKVPKPGTMLPDVSVYDEQGKRFSTSSLRGSYTVLVFGCLT